MVEIHIGNASINSKLPRNALRCETNAQSTINGGSVLMLFDPYFQFDAFEFFRVIIKIKEPYKNVIMSSNPCTRRKVGNKQNSNEHACTNVV